MVFLMAGGGTGGHVIPGIAVARELAARGHEPIFIGTRNGLEAKLVPLAGYPLEFVEVGSFMGQGAVKRLRTILQLPASVLQCLKLLRRYQAAGVFSMGGYVAGPVTLAAALQRISLILMEPNAMPGVTNRLMARFARKALLSFEEAAPYFPSGNVELTGLPVRDEFFEIPFKAPGEIITVLITGGSRGAKTLNEAAKGLWPLIREANLPLRILLQTGANHYDAMARVFSAARVEGRVMPFVEDMPRAFAEADLIVCRSGAGAVAELAAAGKPSILVPYPYAADDHQAKNAAAMEHAGAARTLRDADCTPTRLLAEIRAILAPEVLSEMSVAARGLARRGAARRAADLLEEYAGIHKQ